MIGLTPMSAIDAQIEVEARLEAIRSQRPSETETQLYVVVDRLSEIAGRLEAIQGEIVELHSGLSFGVGAVVFVLVLMLGAMLSHWHLL